MWGTGTPKREFLYVDDLADACIFVINNLNGDTLYKMMNITHLNIGYGEDLTISELAELIAKIVGYKGSIEFDHSKPDGTPRKLLDVSRLDSLGWQYCVELEQGREMTYGWVLDNHR